MLRAENGGKQGNSSGRGAPGAAVVAPCPARFALIRGAYAAVYGLSNPNNPYHSTWVGHPATIRVGGSKLTAEALAAWWDWGWRTSAGMRTGRPNLDKCDTRRAWSDLEIEILRVASCGSGTPPDRWTADLLTRRYAALRRKKARLRATGDLAPKGGKFWPA